MLNFLTQVGFMNEWGNKWDHIYVGSLKMPKLEIIIIHCKFFAVYMQGHNQSNEDDDEEGMNISLDVPSGYTTPIVS